MKRAIVSVAAALAMTLGGGAQAHRDAASEASALSMLPVVVSAALPAGLVLSGAAFTVVAVSVVAQGTVWVLERASDGARFSVTVSASAAAGASLAVGTAVEVLACGAGWVLSAAGRAIAFVPNELGRALLHNERITR